ncbi:translocation/assembly module TamB domain-containing protein [Tianweitania sp. BSSL-BM11]|uniref:Translocation/assembly module TamB domain-containing protein n=1 Tax=Tianweitania aestuarii TaxID=2814886 RepID=A0ABS5RWA1_9HYPH|nr:translocation/assembly module TamB domain-containing protein [Tianweitania aestuarii]MBS9721314.1 translocation/assembly module TamB domain-containing protein [Tianweitania aestuarii]
MTRFLALLALLFVAFPVFAQDEQEDRSYFVGLVEDQLSTPNRQIRLNGIQGALSSDATIGEITIADREGVWLRIVNARINWTRRALLLGRLQISTLSAERIEVTRKPLPEEGLPPPEASSGFALPELPVSVTLDELDVQRVVFGPTVFGLASELALNGRVRLADGSLDTALNVTRLDGPGGKLSLTASYANDSTELGIDLRLEEPENGIVANLLKIENRPPVNLVVSGKGPLEQFDLQLALDAAGERILTGQTSLRRQELGLGFNTTLDGPIASLIPERFRAFFGQSTQLQASGVSKDAGGFRLDQLELASAQLKLSAKAETAADNFLQRLTLDARVDNGGAEPILLPAPGHNTIQRAQLKISFGDTASDQWSGSLDIADLMTENFSSDRVALNFSGLAQNLQDAANRRVSFKVDGGARGLDAPAAQVAEALGSEITLLIDGDWRANQPVQLNQATLSGNGLSVALDGAIADLVFNGNIAVNADSIVPFSALAGRDLAGSLRLTAQGSVNPIGGGFDLTLDGSANGLSIDTPAADALLKGETRLTGGVARGENGLVARQFRLANNQVELTADGRFATGTADFNFDLALSDLALVSQQASGRMTATGRAQGSDGTIRLNLDANVPSGRLMGKSLTQARIGFDGVQLPDLLDGNLTGDAFLDGNRVQLASGVAVSASTRKLSGLSFSAGGANLTGDIQQIVSSGLFDGQVQLNARDVSTAAALFLTKASGAVDATIRLRPVNGNQDGDIKADIRNLVVDQARVGSADVQAEFSDLFKVPGGNATIDARNVVAGGVTVTRLQAQARQNGDTTDFSAETALDNGTTANVAGALSRVQTGFRVNLNELALAQGNTNARLLQPAAITIINQIITIDGVALDVGGGRIDAKGQIAETLDLDVVIANLPLSIGNSVVPDLGLGGTLDGTVKVSGSRSAPDVNFDVRGQGLTAAQLRQAGLSSINVTANGSTQNQLLTVDAAVTSPEGVDARAQGTVPLGQGQLNLDVTLRSLPLGIANAIVPEQNLAGTITGTAQVTGELRNPAASFQLSGSGISATPLADAGVAPLSVQADGAYGDNAVTLNSVQVNGPQGLTVSGNGRVPLSGAGLSVNVDAQAPLALANRFLADRGTQLNGTVNANVAVTGSIQQPNIQGRVTSAGAAVVDPETNLRVSNINVAVGISGQTVTIENVSGAIGGGGTVSASGTIGIAPGSNFPANIAINLNNARYADGELLVATVNGRLNVTGALLQDPLIGGTIDVARAEITVPESFAGGAAAINVKHRNPPAGVRATLARAKANDGTPTPTARPSVARLNITINAPNQVFVRGRGVDAELGGSVQISGPVTNIQPTGGLRMIRGRIGILGQRITFDEGEVTLVGDLNPYLNFVARSEGSDITVFVTVTGRASDIDVKFSSSPELPQDEVLARLIFNRGINELSAFQIAQLAAAAAELAGGGNNSLLGRLRAGTGLDDLDVVTDSEGNAAVRAGRYINENVYLGVEAGAGGNTRATINLDITENLKVKGGAGTTDSSVGVFYERDY